MKRAVACFVLALSGVYIVWLLLAPFVVYATATDYAHPTKAVWVEQKDSKEKTAEVTFNEDQLALRFKQLHSRHLPFPSDLWHCWFLGVLLGVFWGSLTRKMYPERWRPYPDLVGVEVAIIAGGFLMRGDGVETGRDVEARRFRGRIIEGEVAGLEDRGLVIHGVILDEAGELRAPPFFP